MADLEDDVPPLEDMTEHLSLNARKNPSNYVYLEPKSNFQERKTGLIQGMLNEADQQKKIVSSEKPVVQKVSQPTTYCGFKKGFLLNADKKRESVSNNHAGNSKLKAPTTTDDIVEIKSNESSKIEKNVLPEVQEAMSQKFPFLQTDKWITDDLLSKIAKHPKLSKQIMDPRFSEALTAFQSDPKKATELCQKHPEMKEFIQEFSALMGDHFTELGSKEEGATKKTRNHDAKAENATVKTSDKLNRNSVEDVQVQNILSDPKMLEILQDQQVQQMISLLRKDPQKAHHLLQTGGRDLQEKVHRLVQAGLLQVQR